MAQQGITNKRVRLTKLAKADPYHDFGSVFNNWYRLNQPNKDTFLQGLPSGFQVDNDDPQSEDVAFSMVIKHNGQPIPADNPQLQPQATDVNIDFANLFKIYEYPGEFQPLPDYHMMKIHSECKNGDHPGVGSTDPCRQVVPRTNCIYYKKPGIMDVLDKLQEKLVDETDEIHISNFDGERYSVKARNSHIYTGKTRGAIHRNIFRYTEKRLIDAYEFLSYFGLLRKKIVLVVDATAISILEILQNLPTDLAQRGEVLATRIYFVESVETASDSATKSSANDRQFSQPAYPHISSCRPTNAVETVTYNWNTHSPQQISVSGGKKLGGAMTQRIPTIFDTTVGPYQTADTAWPSRYQFQISSRMEPSGKLAASLVVKDANNDERDTITDAEKENNITAVTSKFKKYMGKTTPTDKQKTNIALQQKRSGDWLQVLYCLIAKLRGFKRVHRSDGFAANTPITDIDNVYLLTHDRIALAYGLEMGIDSFFTHGSTGSIWLFEQLRIPDKIARIIIQNREAYQALYRIIHPNQLLQQPIPFPTLADATGRFNALQGNLTAQQTIKTDFLQRHTQAAAGAGNTLVKVFDELDTFPLQDCAIQPRRWNPELVNNFNTLLKLLFRMLWKINDEYKKHPVLLQDLQYDTFTQPLFDRVDAVMTDLAACTGAIRGQYQPFPTDDAMLFTETQLIITAHIDAAQAQAVAPPPAAAQAQAQEALKRLPELIGQLTECCASVERPLIDMQEKTRLLTLALLDLNALDFAQPIQGGTPEVALETFDMNKIKSGYPLSRSGPEFSLLGANIISFLPELTSLPNELKQYIDTRLEEFLRRRVEDLQENESSQVQWKNAVRALIRAMRVYIGQQAPGGVVGGALAGEKGLTRRRQGKKKGNTRKVYRGGNPRIDMLMNEFHRQLIKYVFYLIQNLNNGELVELDTSTRILSEPPDRTIYGYKAESPTVLYKSLIRLVELIKREPRSSIFRSSIFKTLPSTYSGCILIIALLELYNEISNQGKSFYDNLDYDIYIDYFLFLYAKLNGKRATNYFNDKVGKLYRILNNKIISNHFDSFSFSTNRNSDNIHDSIILRANSRYLKELCLIEICKHVRRLSIQPNRFSSLSRVFECTNYDLHFRIYVDEYMVYLSKQSELRDHLKRPQLNDDNLKQLNQIIDRLKNVRQERDIAREGLTRILGMTRILNSIDYSIGIHKVLNDCVKIENYREYLEQNSQDYESTPKNSKKQLKKNITPQPMLPVQGVMGPKPIPPPPDDNPPQFSLDESTTSSTSGRGLKRTRKLNPGSATFMSLLEKMQPGNQNELQPPIFRAGQKKTRKKNIKKYI
jgi:hypothetical protein